MSEKTEVNVLAKFATPLIILATIIWGSSFVVMKSSVNVLPTFWLLAIRFSFAAIVLAVVFWKRWKVLDREYLIGGTVMGFCLFLAYAFQTFGLEQTTSGKNAFFTAVYCVIVPFLYWIIAKRRPDKYNVLAAFLCIAGIALVSITGDNASAFNMGDVLTLVGGFFFACHIIAVSRYSEGRDIFILTTLQFASFALFSWVGVLFTSPAPDPSVFDSSLIFGLVYLVVFASCGALLFQNIGQKYTAPSTAAVLLSLEAPFGVLFSILFADERPTPLMFVGFALIFVAVVCSETKFAFLRKKG
ncbi:DMT family transporter [Intestinimonas sp.]|uniref:DMT family transporter n=1 Tax=Intestinimonas sp. TaxID=1965293 RepID=UPI002612C6D3|nr:DMT family transporter [Intestinimonas sp.]